MYFNACMHDFCMLALMSAEAIGGAVQLTNDTPGLLSDEYIAAKPQASLRANNSRGMEFTAFPVHIRHPGWRMKVAELAHGRAVRTIDLPFQD